MKPHRLASMIILDVILTLWWLLFSAMFFTVLAKTNRPTIRGFTAKGLIVIFNFLISEGERWFRGELKVGRLETSILLQAFELGQVKFAELVGTSRSAVSIWEAEINNHHPSRDKLERMRELAGQKGIDVNDT